MHSAKKKFTVVRIDMMFIIQAVVALFLLCSCSNIFVVFCVDADERDLTLDRDAFMMVRDYMDQTYIKNATNTTNWKWFNSHQSANGYLTYDKARDSIVIAFRGSKPNKSTDSISRST